MIISVDVNPIRMLFSRFGSWLSTADEKEEFISVNINKRFFRSAVRVEVEIELFKQ